MKTLLQTVAVLSTAFMMLGNAEADPKEATEPAANTGSTVVGKVENAVERGAKATAHGIEHGVKAAAGGIKRGAKATARGVERGAKATGNAAERVARKVGLAPAAPSATDKVKDNK